MSIGDSDRLLALVAVQERDASVLGNIEVVIQARSTLDAVDLVKLGARASLVCHLTGLTKKVVSGLYPLLTGVPSPPGQVPFTDTWYLKNNRRMLHANVVWHLFQHFGKLNRSSANILIHVYEAYIASVDAPLLTLTRAFFVPRLITINVWHEQTCDHCGMSYIGPLGNIELICPTCAEYFNHRCSSCGAAIEYHAAGRRKTVCSGCRAKQKRSQKRLTYGIPNGRP